MMLTLFSSYVLTSHCRKFENAWLEQANWEGMLHDHDKCLLAYTFQTKTNVNDSKKMCAFL